MSSQSIASKHINLFVVKDWNSGQPGSHSEYVIINPQYNQPISPCVPNHELAKQLSSGSAEGLSAFQVQDVSDKILSQLDPKDLANFSAASKFCYLTAKSDSIWREKFHQLFPKVIPLGICPFTVDQQFKILFKRYIDELKPFNAQFIKNNELLVRLRGPNGFDSELNQLWNEFQNLGGLDSADFYIRTAGYIDVGSEEQKARCERGRQAFKKYNLYQAQDQLRADLGGQNYDGTPDTLYRFSSQAQILAMINFEIPKIFNEQKKFNEVIRFSAIIKNEQPRNFLESQWMKGNPLILADFGVFSPQEYSEKLECTQNVLEYAGIRSTADLQALGLLKETALEGFKFDDNLSGDLNTKNQQLFQRKKACSDFLEGLSKKIQNKIKESESHGVVLFKDNNNTWLEFQKRFESDRLSILEHCQSPTNLSNNFPQIVQLTNLLVEAFNLENQNYQLIKLRAYIHQVDIRLTWGILNYEGIETLTEFAAKNPNANLFRMGI